MATVGNLFVNVGVRTEQLVSGLARARRALNDFGGGFPLGTLTKWTAALTAGATALGGYYLHAQAEAIDRNHKLAKSLGIATDAFGGLAYAADLSGVGDKLGTSMLRLARMLGDAAGGSKSARDAFATLGIPLRQLEGIGADQAFYLVADSIQAMKSPADQAAAAVAIFGKSGAEMLPLLTSGSAAMRALGDEAKALGLAISGSGAAQVEAANDALTRMKAILAGVANTILVEAAPYIVALGDHMVEAAKKTGGMAETVRTTFATVIPVLNFGANVARILGMGFDLARGSTLAFAAALAKAGSVSTKVLDTLSLGLYELGDVSRDLTAIAKSLGEDSAAAFASAGQAFDSLAHSAFDGIEAGAAKARAQLAALGTAADKGANAVAGFADPETRDEVEDLIERLHVQADTLNRNATEVALYEASLKGANDEQLRHIEALSGWIEKTKAETAAAEEARKAEEGRAAAVAATIERLQVQADTFGMNAADVAYYEASLSGATEEQLRQVEALGQLIQARQQEADLLADGRKVYEAMRTPQEKYGDELDRLGKLLDAGAIAQETFDRASAKAREDLLAATGQGAARVAADATVGISTALGEMKLPGVLDAADAQVSLLDQAERQTGYLEVIASAVAGDRTGGTRSLDAAMPEGLTRVIDEAAVDELRTANASLARIAKSTASLEGALS